MMPQSLVEVPSLPLTAHGKIDFRSLPAPESVPASDEHYAAPRNATEEVLAAIWRDLLKIQARGHPR